MRRPAAAWMLTILASEANASPLSEQNEALFKELREVHALSDAAMSRVKSIFEESGFAGQGNPAVTKHPMTREQCRERLTQRGKVYENSSFEKICGAKYMAPLFDPATEKPEDAKVCIDQFEFPNIPCAYPVVWTRANEAADVCAAVGKRMCDAHEWEGACAGSMQGPDYDFAAIKDLSVGAAHKKLRALHNATKNKQKTWAYGSSFKKGVCAQASTKDTKCNGGNWQNCGTNTYPTGSFPDCESKLGVYDIHGNAAEHMNLPLSESQLASAGGQDLGYTEMKGSWFIWDHFQAHDDSCRWRAPYWHGSRVKDKASHHNYHLGFRCCKSLGKASP